MGAQGALLQLCCLCMTDVRRVAFESYETPATASRPSSRFPDAHKRQALRGAALARMGSPDERRRSRSRERRRSRSRSRSRDRRRSPSRHVHAAAVLHAATALRHRAQLRVCCGRCVKGLR